MDGGTERDSHTETERQRNRETERQRDRETEKLTLSHNAPPLPHGVLVASYATSLTVIA